MSSFWLHYDQPSFIVILFGILFKCHVMAFVYICKLSTNQVMLNKIKKQPFPSQFGIENLINGCVPAINLWLALCPLSKNDNITQTIWFIQNLALKRWICDGLSFDVIRALPNSWTMKYGPLHLPWTNTF